MKTTLSFFSIKDLIIIGCLVVFSQVLVAPMVDGAEQVNNQNLISRMTELGKLTDQDLVMLVQDSRQHLHQIQEALLTKLGSENEDVNFYAAYLLGEYRFPQAANSLARVIALKDKVRSTMKRKSEWLWDRYPAMEALIKIGNPSIPAVIRNLEESDDAEVRDLSLKVLQHIETDSEVAQLRLRRASEAQANPEKKARLQSGLQALLETKSGK